MKSTTAKWNITVGHCSLNDQLVLMTDRNFALIGHTYMTVQGIIIVIAWMALVGINEQPKSPDS